MNRRLPTCQLYHVSYTTLLYYMDTASTQTKDITSYLMLMNVIFSLTQKLSNNNGALQSEVSIMCINIEIHECTKRNLSPSRCHSSPLTIYLQKQFLAKATYKRYIMVTIYTLRVFINISCSKIYDQNMVDFKHILTNLGDQKPLVDVTIRLVDIPAILNQNGF